MKVKTSGDYFPNMLIKLLMSKFKDKLTFLNFGNKNMACSKAIKLAFKTSNELTITDLFI